MARLMVSPYEHALHEVLGMIPAVGHATQDTVGTMCVQGDVLPATVQQALTTLQTAPVPGTAEQSVALLRIVTAPCADEAGDRFVDWRA